MPRRNRKPLATPTLMLALVGRPNVGKSTLFNRLVGRRDAIVDDTPGVTRDRREGVGQIGKLSFGVLDTAGWDTAPRRSLADRMREQTERAVAEADAALLILDARAGVTPVDQAFARWLRTTGKPVIVVANKSEGKAATAGLAEAHALGLGDPLPVSAEHGEGLDALRAAIEALPRAGEAAALPQAEDDEEENDEPEAASRPIRMAIVGRPNVGKSSLLNRLLGEERTLVGPEAGITRDSIAVDWEWQGRKIRLVDTAGLRRKSQVSQKLEAVAAQDALETIRRSEVVVLVLDATQMLEKQDLTIARGVIDEGRALVVMVNKMDLLSADGKDGAEQRRKLLDRIEASLAQVKGVAVVPVSARTGRGLEKLMPAVIRASEIWNKRIPTATFNRWLGEILERHPPPLSKGRRIRIRYGTQSSARPPTFALFVSKAAELPDSYSRYLVNRLRQDFDLPGTPIRVVLRQPKNPYAGRD